MGIMGGLKRIRKSDECKSGNMVVDNGIIFL